MIPEVRLHVDISQNAVWSCHPEQRDERHRCYASDQQV